MVKVMYFDESSTIDYLDIYNGGNEKSEKESKQIKNKDAETKAEVKGNSRFSTWFAGVSSEVGATGTLSKVKETIVKTTISNTILTEFLEKAVGDSKITKIIKHEIYPPKDSFAYLKMFTPFLLMTNSQFPTSNGIQIDASKIDEALKSGKGYYEMLATNKEKEKSVLRFNILAFRNNYSISDLPKMDLEFYCIKVGTTKESLLGYKNEMEMNQTCNSSTSLVMELENDGSGENSSENEPDLPLYDVLLAGVTGG